VEESGDHLMMEADVEAGVEAGGGPEGAAYKREANSPGVDINSDKVITATHILVSTSGSSPYIRYRYLTTADGTHRVFHKNKLPPVCLRVRIRIGYEFRRISIRICNLDPDPGLHLQF